VRIYLDEDSAAALLVSLLRRAGHDVEVPADVGLAGQNDPVHLTRAVQEDRVLLSHNYDHFKELHDLIVTTRGHHPGILTVRRDNDPKRDLSAKDIVRAIGKLIASGVPIKDNLHVLNHWR
jgi:hypothetical protein